MYSIYALWASLIQHTSSLSFLPFHIVTWNQSCKVRSGPPPSVSAALPLGASICSWGQHLHQAPNPFSFPVESQQQQQPPFVLKSQPSVLDLRPPPGLDSSSQAQIECRRASIWLSRPQIEGAQSSPELPRGTAAAASSSSSRPPGRSAALAPVQRRRPTAGAS